MSVNIVELIAGPDESAFDQRCKFGHRVEGHAVYCHNDAWGDSPRKCRRSWYTGGEVKDEDCPGFQPNEAFKGELSPTAQSGDRCSQCGGTKLIATEAEKTETCPRCMGSGEEPRAMPLNTFEQDTLEMGLKFSGRHSGQHDYYNRIAESKKDGAGVSRLNEMDLIDLRSVSWTKAGATVYLIRLTPKGEAVLRAVWDAKKNH